MRGFGARDWIFFAPCGCSEDPHWWSYPMPLNAFGVSGIFISSLVKASFHRSKTKMPLKLRLKGIVPGTGFLPSWVTISYKFCVSNRWREIKKKSKCFV